MKDKIGSEVTENGFHEGDEDQNRWVMGLDCRSSG